MALETPNLEGTQRESLIGRWKQKLFEVLLLLGSLNLESSF